MIKIRRYEVFPHKTDICVYDRFTHTFVNAKAVSNKQEMIPAIRSKEHMFCIYPHKYLCKCRINPRLLLVGFLLTIIGFAVSILIMLASSYSFHFKTVVQALIAVPVLSVFSIVVHELAHALCGASLGGSVVEVGIRLKKGQPKYYTSIIWPRASQINRILFYFAGIASNMILAMVGAFLFYFYNRITMIYLFVINVVLTVINLIPTKKEPQMALKLLNYYNLVSKIKYSYHYSGLSIIRVIRTS